MNKIRILLLSGAFFLFCGVVHAQVTPLSFYQIWMTNVDQVTPSASESSFDWGETPYLYIEIKDPALAKPISTSQTTVTWKWNDPALPAENDSHTDGYFANTNAQWIPYELTETGENWSAIQKTGYWTVDATSSVLYADGDKRVYNGSTSFNVNPVPEPISCLLFLVGGIPLLRRLKK